MHGRRRLALASFLAACVISQLAQSAAAASYGAQKASLSRVGTCLKAAGRLASAERFEDAADKFAEAEKRMRELQSEGVSPKLAKIFARRSTQLDDAYSKLKAAGVELGDKPNLEASMSSGGGSGRFSPTNVSFVRDIAPMFTSKCGRCHVDGRRGNFSLASYADLMQGVNGASVLAPGDGSASMLTEVIVSGDMPRGGGEVSPAEVNKLVTWINQGAEFDGGNETTNLRRLLAEEGEPAGDSKEPEMKVRRATGKETVSFALDVAPVLTARCADCHAAGRPRGDLSLATFRGLLSGGDSGAAIKAGNAAGSLLIQRLKGEITPRMPQNRPPLSAKEIDTISTWINEGAAFDGEDARTRLPRVTALVRAERATPEQLSAMRAERAERNWRLATAGEASRTAKTDRFYLMGNVPESRLAEIGAEAERLADKTLQLFNHPTGQPLAKGRITLFALSKRIDYGEFGLMVQRRQPPKSERVTHAFDVVDSYAAMQLGAVPDPEDTTSIAQAVTAAYLEERTVGRLPAWFVDGVSRAVAAKADRESPRVAAWLEALPSAAGSVDDPAQVLGSRLPPEEAGLLRFGFAEALLRKPSKIAAVVGSVAEGKRAGDAIERVFGKTPEQLVPLWTASLRRQR